MMAGKALVVLSGCGNRDGSEIHESVCAVLALVQSGFQTVFAAPDIEQSTTLNHLSGKPAPPRRVLEEAARIARGRIRPLASVTPSDYDLAVLPGGMGAVLSLCGYARRTGAAFEVEPSTRALVLSAREAGRPIGAMCIAPMILAACLPGVTITLGSECEAAAHARSLGALTVECPASDAVTDAAFRVVTTPAYMVAGSIDEVHLGAARMVEELESLL
jgi:enhancing lycopene biosynthesis protein 2